MHVIGMKDLPIAQKIPRDLQILQQELRIETNNQSETHTDTSNSNLALLFFLKFFDFRFGSSLKSSLSVCMCIGYA